MTCRSCHVCEGERAANTIDCSCAQAPLGRFAHGGRFDTFRHLTSTDTDSAQDHGLLMLLASSALNQEKNELLNDFIEGGLGDGEDGRDDGLPRPTGGPPTHGHCGIKLQCSHKGPQP